MIDAFLDANFLFTASHSPTGATREIIRLALHRPNLSVHMTQLAVSEAEDNLKKKSPASLPMFHTLRPTIQICAAPTENTELRASKAAPTVPRKDLPILAGAVGAGVDWFVTHDKKHFGQLYGTDICGVLVLKPKDALRLIRYLT